MKDLTSNYEEVAETLWKHGYGNAQWSAGFISAAITFDLSLEDVVNHIKDGKNIEGPTWSMLERFYRRGGELSTISRRSVRQGKIDLEAMAVDLHAIHDKIVSTLDQAMDGVLDPTSISKISAGISAMNKNVQTIDHLVNRDREERKKLPVNINVMQIQRSIEELVDPDDVPKLRKMLMKKAKSEVIDVGEIVSEEAEV